MDFKTYWLGLSAEAKRAMALTCETSVAYLSQVAHGHRKASPGLAKTIERETGGTVVRSALRPDIYSDPEAAHA
jgi:DNA-binding transcriptional regulator YdaS (Cro superfamily)